jgi:prolyl oligopeptidase
MGGYLTSVMMTQRPASFAAAVMENPMIDVLHNFTYVSGKKVRESNPEIYPLGTEEERRYAALVSPYEAASRAPRLPPAFIATSTTDDGVPPEMARRFARTLQQAKHRYYYWESPNSAHWVCSGRHECNQYNALLYTFLWKAMEKSGHNSRRD